MELCITTEGAITQDSTDGDRVCGWCHRGEICEVGGVRWRGNIDSFKEYECLGSRRENQWGGHELPFMALVSESRGGIKEANQVGETE
jgi:hypothetical protein